MDWNLLCVWWWLYNGVTPCVGVWIETGDKRTYRTYGRVTPCVGVWIETAWIFVLFLRDKRHTLRGCVDWNYIIYKYYICIRKVTPCVGVWIETISFAPLDNFVGSHPAWVCGLKHVCLAYFGCQIGSHPAWVCGLKRRLIEIFTDKGESHPAWVCGLKLKKMSITPSRVLSHPAWVCGLKHENQTYR